MMEKLKAKMGIAAVKAKMKKIAENEVDGKLDLEEFGKLIDKKYPPINKKRKNKKQKAKEKIKTCIGTINLELPGDLTKILKVPRKNKTYVITNIQLAAEHKYGGAGLD